LPDEQRAGQTPRWSLGDRDAVEEDALEAVEKAEAVDA
jgi:hypothetical protein